jgi:MoaA/NifB/PqqE/SkfB family radical SAM enzyme
MENRQKESQNYDAYLLWRIPGKCNLFCEYCYNHPAERKNLNARESIRSFLDKIKRQTGNISQIGVLGAIKVIYYGRKEKTGKMSAIDIPVLINTLDKTNRVFRIAFTGGGEPFLNPNIIEICERTTEKHYISFNTNLTSKKIEEFCRKIDPRKVIEIHASLHIKELERLHLLDLFVNNFLLCKERGISIVAVEIAYPKLCDEVDKYKEIFKKKGIEFTFDRFQGIYHGKEYPAAYTERELETFDIKEAPNLNFSLCSYGKICNAGYNAAVVRSSGDVMLCDDIPEKLGHICKGIQFKNHLTKCIVTHCHCPLNVYDIYLYEKALKESKASPFALDAS